MRTLIRYIVVIALLAVGNLSFAQNFKPNSNLSDEMIVVQSPEENKIYHIEHFSELDGVSYVVLQEIKVKQKKKTADGMTVVNVETIGKPIFFVIKGKIPTTFDESFDGSLFVAGKVIYFYNLSSEKSRPLQAK